MMDAVSIIILSIGVPFLGGFVYMLYIAYVEGKKSQQLEQEKANVKILETIQQINSSPKPTTADVRNSLHRGEF